MAASHRALSRTYTALLHPEDGGYTVTVPALPGVVTQGGTVRQCLERVREAIALHLAALAEDGEPLPEEHAQSGLLRVTIAT